MSALKVCPQCGTEYELDQRFCPKDGSTLRSQNAGGDLVGTIVADRYHVLKKLGEGGMGSVYLAEHVKMGRKSAVKVMNPGMAQDADAISRFNREAANASRINHPNVAAVYDFGETGDGVIYLAMEFVEGPSLTKVVQELGALPAARAADITRQAADALAVAHDMGIVHRDLKPDNIMLAKNRDGSDCVKVVDFGIAKAANAENQKVTKTGLVVGTPEYMSPEQLAGDKLDGRSDIYSLALVAFNMMTGRLPFPGETVQESMIMRLTDKPKPLAEMKPDTAWTPEVQAVLDKALARDAKDRYQTAAEFGRELVKAVDRMPQTEATNAFTAFISSSSLPIPHDAKTTAIPQTRVSSATPVQGSPKVPAAGAAAPKAKSSSKMPMLVGVAAVVVAAAGFGVWKSMQVDGSNAAAPQGEALRQEANGVPATSPPAVNIDSLLAVADSLTGLTASNGSVAQALGLLSGLPDSLTSDQTVYATLVRAQAMSFRDENDPRLCPMLQEVKEQAKQTKYNARVAFLLQTCSK